MSESDVVTEVPAVEPAPEKVETTPPVTEETKSDEKLTEAAKTFTQEELDAIVSKRLAREQRKWEREQAARRAAQPQKPVEVPPADQFESPEKYAEALAEQKALELIEKRERERQQVESLRAYHEREDGARDRYDDFEQVAYNPNLPITAAMAETIRESELGPDIAYHLGNNPEEARRISRLSPFLQAKEIGRIEAKLAVEPPAKKTSSAPAPIAPVTARTSGNASYDTTDPRSVKSMSTSEWIEAERQRQIRKWEAQRNR